MEYIITFKNTSVAIKAEQYLLEQKLQINVIPLPSRIGEGCGICLRVNPDEIKQALNTLADKAINEIDLFSRLWENGQLVYTEIKDRSVLILLSF